MTWYSSFGSDFNYDFHVTLDETVAPVEYNYTEKAVLLAKGESYFTEGESHGLSVFLREGDSVYHTYSAYARGTDLLQLPQRWALASYGKLPKVALVAAMRKLLHAV